MSVKNLSVVFFFFSPHSQTIFHLSKTVNNGSKTSNREQKNNTANIFSFHFWIHLTALKQNSILLTSEETQQVYA